MTVKTQSDWLETFGFAVIKFRDLEIIVFYSPPHDRAVYSSNILSRQQKIQQPK